LDFTKVLTSIRLVMTDDYKDKFFFFETDKVQDIWQALHNPREGNATLPEA